MISSVSTRLTYNWDNKLRSAAGSDTIALAYDLFGNRILENYSDVKWFGLQQHK